jgi:hypothetical protein
VNLRRRLRATTTVAILGFCMATTLFVPTSFASSHSSPRSSSASSPSGSGCSKTNAVAHNPIKVGYPDAKSSMVNRTFTLNTNCGQIVFKTWGKKAPATVIAMAFLAKSG